MTPPHPDSRPQLERRLGLGDAVVLGLGSTLGAGVFATFAPAAAAAGAGLLIALAIAAIVEEAWRLKAPAALRKAAEG